MSAAASPSPGLAWLGGSFAASCVLSLTRTLVHLVVVEPAIRKGSYREVETLSKTLGVLSSSVSVAVAAASLVGLMLTLRALRPHARGLLTAAVALQAVATAVSLLWPVAWLVGPASQGVERLFDYAGIAHSLVFLALVVTLALGLTRAARSLGLHPPIALAIVSIVAVVLEVALNNALSIDAVRTIDPATRQSLFAVIRFVWPAVAALLAAFVFAARSCFARAPVPDHAQRPTAVVDADALAAAHGLTTLRTIVWIRIGVGIAGVVLLRIVIASGSPDAGQGIAWIVFVFGLVTSLVFASSLYSIGRLPLARGPATTTLVLVVLGIPVDGWITSLTTRMLVKPTSFWDSSLHDAMEAAKTLPTAMIVSSIVSIAAAILLFVTLAAVARSVGSPDLEARATNTLWLAAGAFVLIGIGQVGALQGWISIPVLLVTALGGLVLAITVLARVMGLAGSLAARLTG